LTLYFRRDSVIKDISSRESFEVIQLIKKSFSICMEKIFANEIEKNSHYAHQLCVRERQQKGFYIWMR
jgi:hydroxyacyl-ACP dehydratase HTD2-like protein with hotdog domain